MNKVQNKVYCGEERRNENIRRMKRSIQNFSEVQSNSSISHLHTKAGWLKHTQYFFSYLTKKIHLNIYIFAYIVCLNKWFVQLKESFWLNSHFNQVDVKKKFK